jgi:glycine dehydrogenase subunit 2
LDFGVHAPTIYFPLIVPEALMIEPTESESKQDVDALVDDMRQISEEAHRDPETVMSAPHSTARGRLDEYRAAHPKTLTLSWRMHLARGKEQDER